MRRLQFDRLYKTDYELACLREANRIAARGHLAAGEAFAAGRSEFEIHLTYLRAVGQTDAQLPYANIVALNEHAATLHYDASEANVPAVSRSFLLDAGADYGGYAADITRTWAAPTETAFGELVALLDEAQQALIESIRPGVEYLDLHEQMHRQIAGILAATGLVDMAPDAMSASGITSAFFPHGDEEPVGAGRPELGKPGRAFDRRKGPGVESDVRSPDVVVVDCGDAVVIGRRCGPDPHALCRRVGQPGPAIGRIAGGCETTRAGCCPHPARPCRSAVSVPAGCKGQVGVAVIDGA